jgi:hypothetical protein
MEMMTGCVPRSVQVHLVTQDAGEVFVPPRKIPAGAGFTLHLRQHIHVAALRIEIVDCSFDLEGAPGDFQDIREQPTRRSP